MDKKSEFMEIVNKMSEEQKAELIRLAEQILQGGETAPAEQD